MNSNNHIFNGNIFHLDDCLFSHQQNSESIKSNQHIEIHRILKSFKAPYLISFCLMYFKPYDISISFFHSVVQWTTTTIHDHSMDIFCVCGENEGIGKNRLSPCRLFLKIAFHWRTKKHLQTRKLSQLNNKTFILTQ